MENKFYADLGGHDDHPAAGPAAPPARRRRGRQGVGPVRHDAHARAAGRPRLGVADRHRLGLGGRAGRGCRSCWPRRCGRRASRPGDYDLVVDPSNLWLTIHESIGHATELDRALGYEAAYAGTSFATFDQLGKLRVRLARDERHRRPHRRARAGDRSATTTRASRAQSWDIVKDGAAGRLPARPADRAAEGSRPVQRVRVRRLARRMCRSSGWRTCRCSRIRTGRPPRS